MCVCWSLASVCGSREPFLATFSATRRSPSWRSFARKTRANPPRPSSSTRWNPAIVCPASGNGGRAIDGDRPREAVDATPPEPTRSWISSTRRRAGATSGNRPVKASGSGVSPPSSRRQYSS